MRMCGEKDFLKELYRRGGHYLEQPLTILVIYGIIYVLILLAYFSCELFPGAPSLNTSPESNSCWQQAFFPLPKPVVLHQGGNCTLKVTIHKDQLLCALRDVILPENEGNSENAGPSSSTTSKNRTGEELDIYRNEFRANLPLKRFKRDENTTDFVIAYKDYLSLDGVTILPNNDFILMNDKELLDFFKRSLAGIQQKSAVDDQDVYVLDITNLSLLSLTLMDTYPEMHFSCYNNDAHRVLQFFSSVIHSFAPFPDGQGDDMLFSFMFLIIYLLHM